MRYIFSIVFIFIIPIIAFTQEDNYKSIKKGDVLVKISPLSIFDPFMPNIEIGASYFLEDNLGIQLKVGSKYDIFSLDDEYKTYGFKCDLEYQYFIKRRIYLSIENGIAKNKYSDKMTYLLSETDENEIEDNYYVLEEKIYFGPKFGIMLFPTERLLIDFYAGLSLQRNVRTVYELEFDESLGHVDPNLYEWFGQTYLPKEDYEPKISLGVNINFRF